MTSLEQFAQQASESLSSQTLEPEQLARLSAELGGAGAAVSLGELLAAHMKPAQTPVFLLKGRRALPRVRAFKDLLGEWESDANLQDDFLDLASGRQLQEVKAYYMLALRKLEADTDEHDERRARTFTRLISKVSNALMAHRDNARGECDIYGSVRATAFMRSGKIASTYEGRDLESDERVAVQVIKPELQGNQVLVHSFVAGTLALRDLRHPQIAGVLDPASRPESYRDKVFAVTEWKGSKTLEDLILSGGMGLAARQALAVDICKGLSYIHRKGGVHGNLNPDNILVADAAGVFLTGFLAPADDMMPGAWGQIAATLGSPYYIAPELTSGGLPTVASDLFALGRVLYRLLTGKEENLYEVMVPQLYTQALQQHLASYPDLMAILERMGNLQAGDRPASAGEIMAELQRFGGELGVSKLGELDALRAAGSWGDLLSEAQALIDVVDAGQQRALLSDMACIQEYVLGDSGAALTLWARLYRVDADGRRMATDTLDRLRRDLGDAYSAQAVADAFADAVEEGHVEDPAEALELSLRAARLYRTEVGNADRAITCFMRALELDPANDEAFKALDDLFQQQLDWPGLVGLLERRELVLEETEDQIKVLFRIATIQEDSRWDAEAAAEAYGRVLELDDANEVAFQNYDRLLRELSRWDDLVVLLETRIAASTDDLARWSLQYDLAEIHRDKRARPELAIELYRAILGEHADHEETIKALEGLLATGHEALAAARLLEPIYRRREAWAPLADALEVLLTDIQPDDDRWSATLREIAELRENHELDAVKAFGAFARLHQAHPRLDDVQAQLERLAPQCEPALWGRVVALYRASIEQENAAEEPDTAFVAALWSRIGAIQREKLADAEEAITAYRAVLDAAPGLLHALEQLEALYTETGAHLDLTGVLETRAAMALEAGDVAGARALYHRIAGIQEESIGDASEAVETLHTALDLEGDDPHALAELERLAANPELLPEVAAILDPLYTRTSAFAKLSALLLSQLEHDPAMEPTPVRAAVRARLADLAEHQFGDLAAALGHMIEAVASDLDRADLREELARLTAASVQWQRVASFYDGLLAARSDLADDLRLMILTRIGTWYWRELTEPGEAVERFRAALELDPEHEPSLVALDALYTELDWHKDLVAILRRRASLAEGPADEIALRFRIAELADTALNLPDQAIAALERIYSLDAANRAALVGLAAILERLERWNDLVGVLHRTVAVEDESEAKVALLWRVGRIALDELQDNGVALDALLAAVELEPASPADILRAILDIHLAHDDVANFFVWLPRVLKHSKDKQERVDLNLRAARLAQRPDAPASASPMTYFEQVLRHEPYHAAVLDALEKSYTAHQEWSKLEDIYRRQFVGLHLKAAHLALHGLESANKALEHLLQARALDPHRIEVVDRLIEVYRATDDRDALNSLLDLRLDLMEDEPEHKAQLLIDRAAGHLLDGKRSEALDTYTRALLLVPHVADALVTFTRLALELDRWAELGPQIVGAIRKDVIERGTQGLLASMEQANRSAAAFLEGRPEAATDALDTLTENAEVDPQFLLDILQAVFAHFGAMDELVGWFRGAADRIASPRWTDALLTKSAELAEAAGDLEQALSVYTRLFEKDPGLTRARGNMLRLATSLGRVEEALAAIGARLRGGLEDKDLLVELALMLARHYDVAERSAEQREEAVAYYEQVLSVAPAHRESLDALTRIFEAQADAPRLARVLERTIRVLPNPVARAELRMKLARLVTSDPDTADVERAAALAVEVLESDLAEDNADRTAARELLEHIVDGDQSAEALVMSAATTLRKEYGALGRVDKILALLERHYAALDVADDPAENLIDKLELLADLAATAEGHREVGRAFDYRLRWFAFEPENVTLRGHLEAAAESDTSRLNRLADAYLVAMQQEDLFDDAKLEVGLKAARWQAERLDRQEEALGTYEFVLAIDPNQEEALQTLEQLFTTMGLHEPLFELLLRKARVAADFDDKRALLIRAAELAERSLKDPDKAARCYEALLDDFGPNAEVLGRLEQIHASSGNLEGQLMVLRFQIELARAEDPDRVHDLLLRTARLAHEEVGDFEAAIVAFEGLLELDPTHEEALGALSGLYQETARWAQLMTVVEKRSLLVEDPHERFPLTLWAATIAAENLGEVEIAIECLRDARAINAEDPTAKEMLYRLLEQAGLWSELLAYRFEDLDTHRDDIAAQVEGSLQIARLALAEDMLNDLELGKTHLRRVLELAPDSVDATRQLLALDLRTEDWADAVQVIQRLLGQAADVAEQVTLLMQQGDLLRDKLGDTNAAMTAYQYAYQYDATGQSGARERLVELYTAAGAWPAVMQIYEHDIERAPTVEEKVSIELRLAQTIKENGSSPQHLIEVLDRAYHRGAEFPSNLDIIGELIEAYASVGAIAEAGAWVDRGFEIADEAGAKDRLGGLWYYKGLVSSASGNIHAAIVGHQECFKLDSRRLDNILALARLLYETQQWNEALKVLQVALLKQNELSNDEKLEMYYLMGMIRVETGDARRAKDMFRRALGVDKNHAPSQSMLASLG